MMEGPPDVEDLDVMCAHCSLATRVPPNIPLYGACRRNDLEPGQTYQWCSCGLSASQPLCDGKCASTGFKPIAFVAKEQTWHTLCGCKVSECRCASLEGHRLLACGSTRVLAPTVMDRTAQCPRSRRSECLVEWFRELADAFNPSESSLPMRAGQGVPQVVRDCVARAHIEPNLRFSSRGRPHKWNRARRVLGVHKRKQGRL